MADINVVLAQLKANKKKIHGRAHNHMGATRRTGTRRSSRNSSRLLGRFKGYCPTCYLILAEEDYRDGSNECPSCGSQIKKVSRVRRPDYRLHEPWGNSEIPG
jgi:DNA-directed RNA polymerase subunit RPC12/RpoP